MSAKALLSASLSAPPAVYVEDVFSTYLYTGNGSTQTITNGIDLAGEGGLVWTKPRVNDGVNYHALFDTARGVGEYLSTHLTSGQGGSSTTLEAFNAAGFTLGSSGLCNGNTYNYASWTFRKAEKFFDVVTYTGSGSNRTIAHNLGSVPGCIIVKCLNINVDWQVYHQSLANTEYMVLNTTAAKATGTTRWNSTTPTSTVFSLGTDITVNASGGNYVAYLFAHDAGGFGDAGTDSVVKCGSYTGTGAAGNNVTLGWEPQWLLIKQSSDTGSWVLIDSMRGFPVGSADSWLYANLSDAESAVTSFAPTATGFVSEGSTLNTSGQTYIYIAIRRGPMKTPTVGTEVFSANAFTSSSNGITTTGFPPDLVLYANRDRTAFSNTRMADRLRGAITSGSGVALDLMTESTAAEGAVGSNIVSTDNVSFKWQSGNAGYSMVSESFRRAPGFFDVVAYSADGAGFSQTIKHNLGVVPELIIVKHRSGGSFGNTDWLVYSASLGNALGLSLNLTSSSFSTNAWGKEYSSPPTSTQITLGNFVNSVNGANGKYVGYLFATLTGVSKVGSYTGTGTTLNVDCGFTAGARFVMIKRTDSTGDWYVWDTARGIISGNDPYILLNSTNAEVTNTDYIDPLSSGFQISSTAPAAINANGGSFIFLAIA